MILLPIEPNLKALQDIFIFEYTKYQKVKIEDFELKLMQPNFLMLHEVTNIFESGDVLKFYSKDYGTKKEPKFSRYIFYKTKDDLYFVARLNDVNTLFNYIGVNENFLRIFPKTDLSTRIYKTWKKPLKKFSTKIKRGSSNIDVNIFAQ